jgi:hypothetical protein
MNITAQEIITELSMSYSHSMHLIVEGNTDVKLFQSLIEGAERVNIIDACGSDVVVASIALAPQARLQNPQIAPILGVVDRDYRFPSGSLTLNPDLLVSDLRDIECMMMDTPAFEAVLTELGSPKKVAAHGGGDKVKDTLFAACRPIAWLRYLSKAQNLNFCFQKLDFEKFVDKRTMALDEMKLISHLSGLQPSGTTRRPTIKDIIDGGVACADAEHPPGVKYFTSDLLLLRGHDLMTSLGLGLRFLWGSLNAVEATGESIERHFRLAFRAHFHLTNMCACLLVWLASNALSAKVRLHP